MFLVFLGAPGAGKGTQADIISQKLGVPHIASGDLFRQAVEKGSKLGQLVKSYMEKGALVPDEVTIQVISERLSESDCKKGCVFDGFPRTLEQAKALDGVMAKHKDKIDKALFDDTERLTQSEGNFQRLTNSASTGQFWTEQNIEQRNEQVDRHSAEQRVQDGAKNRKSDPFPIPSRKSNDTKIRVQRVHRRIVTVRFISGCISRFLSPCRQIGLPVTITRSNSFLFASPTIVWG